MGVQIGRLERLPLQSIWKHEALDFTPWLAENIEALSEALGLVLKVEETEKTVGSFSLDILAKDAVGQLVVIENQIYKTDHDHLGKVLTYLTNLGAKTAIWLTSDARPEHIRAVAWLNESSPPDVSFYLVRVEAYRIGESLPAPLFSRIVEPTREAKEIGQQKEELAQRHVDRLEFWTQLLAKAKTRTPLHANISPGVDNWVSAGAGIGTISFGYVILMTEARVEMYIDGGSGSEHRNKAIFDRLIGQRSSIESVFGAPLNWERLDARRASRISYSLKRGGLTTLEQWPEIQEEMISAMTRLHASLFEPTREAVAATAA